MTGLPPDVRVFLGRLTHLDPGALTRLRPRTGGWTGFWGRLPWGVLVTRVAPHPTPEDLTVRAADLLADTATWPARRDAEWQWPLPPDGDVVLEEIPAGRLREVAAAAAGTLREVSQTGLAGRPVGARVVRDALLDHVPIVVEADGVRCEVSQRLVQAVVRMGFLGAASAEPAGAGDPGTVRVRRVDRWVGLAAPYGTAWLPPRPISITPVRQRS